MSRIIGIVSSKGGVGKTTVALNLAAALMEMKKNVIAVDADLKMSGLSLQLGLYHFPVTLNDVLNRETNVYEAIYNHYSGLKIIPASLCIQEANVSKLAEALNDPFLENYVVLVDAPPGLENNSAAVLEACNEIIIVTTPETPAVVDTMKTISVAEKFNVNPLGIIVNQYKRNNKDQISPKEIEFTCNLPIIGIIPEDKEIRKSIFRKTPVVFFNPYSPSSMEFMKIAARLSNEIYKPPKLVFLRKFLRRIKK